MYHGIRDLVYEADVRLTALNVVVVDENGEGSRYNSRTPFIVLASPNDLKCYQQALELGAVEYLEKPVSTAELNRVIQRYLGSPTCIL
jgi:CheY-like chemotaxis protein